MDKIEILKEGMEELKNEYKDITIYRYCYITKDVIELKISCIYYSSGKDAYGKHKKNLFLFFTEYKGVFTGITVYFSIDSINELLNVGKISLYYYDENYIFIINKEMIPDIQKEYEIECANQKLKDDKEKIDKEKKLKKISYYIKKYNITKEDINKLNK